VIFNYNDNDEQLQMLILSYDMMWYFFYIFTIKFKIGQIFASTRSNVTVNISPVLAIPRFDNIPPILLANVKVGPTLANNVGQC